MLYLHRRHPEAVRKAAELGRQFTFDFRILEPGLPFISLLFEAVSAYSTAGLSTGITAQLCLPAKLVLIFTMYTGRVGAFTLLSLWVERPEPNAHFTEEAITIG